MRFYESENEWSVFKGVWCTSEQPCTSEQSEDWDYLLEDTEMDLMVNARSDNDEDFEFRYVKVKECYDDLNFDNSWYLNVTVTEPSGTPDAASVRVYDTETNEFMGWVDVSNRGNRVENILLGFYDLIEAHCQGRKIFGITC